MTATRRAQAAQAVQDALDGMSGLGRVLLQHVPDRRTIPTRRLSSRALDLASPEELAELRRLRPRTRADCAGVPRPCPFVGCRWHLFLDVRRSGSLLLNFPGLDPSQLPPRQSCVLDVIADAPAGLPRKALGRLLGIGKDRVRQLELEALARLRADLGEEQLRLLGGEGVG